MIPSFDYSNLLRILGLGWVRAAACSPVARRLALSVSIGAMCATVSVWFVPFFIPVPDAISLEGTVEPTLWNIASYCLHFDYLFNFITLVDRVLVAFPPFYVGLLLTNFIASSYAEANRALDESLKLVTGR